MSHSEWRPRRRLKHLKRVQAHLLHVPSGTQWLQLLIAAPSAPPFHEPVTIFRSQPTASTCNPLFVDVDCGGGPGAAAPSTAEGDAARIIIVAGATATPSTWQPVFRHVDNAVDQSEPERAGAAATALPPQACPLALPTIAEMRSASLAIEDSLDATASAALNDALRALSSSEAAAKQPSEAPAHGAVLHGTGSPQVAYSTRGSSSALCEPSFSATSQRHEQSWVSLHLCPTEAHATLSAKLTVCDHRASGVDGDASTHDDVEGTMACKQFRGGLASGHRRSMSSPEYLLDNVVTPRPQLQSLSAERSAHSQMGRSAADTCKASLCQVRDGALHPAQGISQADTDATRSPSSQRGGVGPVERDAAVAQSPEACSGRWELNSHAAAHVRVLLDADINLREDLVRVERPVVAGMRCRALPPGALLLGLQPLEPRDHGGGEEVDDWVAVQPQAAEEEAAAETRDAAAPLALALWPKAECARVQPAFLADNAWLPASYRPIQEMSPAHNSSIISAIRNAFFPFHSATAKQAVHGSSSAHSGSRRPLPRVCSSPGLRGHGGSSPPSTLAGGSAAGGTPRRATASVAAVATGSPRPRHHRAQSLTGTAAPSGLRSRVRHVRNESTSAQTDVAAALRSAGVCRVRLTQSAASEHSGAPSVPDNATARGRAATVHTTGSAVRSRSQESSHASDTEAVEPGGPMSAMQYVGIVLPQLRSQLEAIGDIKGRVQRCRMQIAELAKASTERSALECELQRLQVCIRQIRQANDGRMRRVTHVRRLVASKRQRLQDRWARLQDAEDDGGAFAGAHEASKALRQEFPVAAHQWRETLGALITRRHQLVVSTASLFRLGPKPVLRHHGGVLTEMQDRWMLKPCLTSGPAAQPRSLASAVSAPLRPVNGGSLGATFSSGVAVNSGDSQNGSRAPPAPHAAPPRVSDGLVSRVTPVMTIMDLEISSDVAQRAQLGELGWDTSALLNLSHLNAAYGFIAQLTVFLSVVLDVPLLYHIELCGSHCSIRQAMPELAHRAALKHGHLEADEAGPSLREAVHPLYIVQGKQDKMKRFAWGCFLLGTNVQSLLAAHGISSHGAQYLLENLERLAATARSSGLSPGL